ncbi:hypothetical protein C8R47DRAFT_244538 [Mycena vitilis]|nr:hypothetical protein C8R47DRAFT_244538 [Mycena vitilis]
MVFTIYMPKGSPKLKDTAGCSSFTDQELHAFEAALPHGGTIHSTHHPTDALSWVEAHYNDGFIACMRLRGLGGPVATMLSPERQALALFGSIQRQWVLRAAQTLADISGFAVIVQPRLNDPVLQWDRPADNIIGSVVTGDGDATRDQAETGGMASPSGDGDIDEYAGWMSPVHRSDTRLQLRPRENIAHDVSIVAETQFKVQHRFEDKNSDRRVLPNRSHSNIGFFSREQWVLDKEWYNCGFDRIPSKTRKHRSPKSPTRLTGTSIEGRDGLV